MQFLVLARHNEEPFVNMGPFYCEAIATNCNAAGAKNSLKDPANGKRQQTLESK